uniref:Uncharacterized protein n=1 Tax=Oryza punctata TaxID=4537 RepID=A0A0E0JMH2_ORYPU
MVEEIVLGFGVLGSLEWHPFWRGKRKKAGDNESDGDERARRYQGVAITDLFKLTVDEVFSRVSVTELAGWRSATTEATTF